MPPVERQRRRGGPVITLTGATGFLGGHIASILVDGGYRVRAAVRPTSDLSHLPDDNLEVMTVDLADPENCLQLVRGARGVIHCAGLVSADREQAYQRANVETTRALLQACRQEWHPQGGAAFVLVSSLAAHGPSKPDHPAREDDPCHPTTAYGRSKLAAEQLVLHPSHRFRTAILRPPALYGPGDRAFLPLVKMATHGWTVRFGGPMRKLSLVHGLDAARAAVNLIEQHDAQGVFFVDDGKAGYTWDELAAALSTACGRKVRALTIPLGVLKFLGTALRPLGGSSLGILRRDRIQDLEAPGWVCDGSRLQGITGFKATFDAPGGLADTLRFYREQSWL